MNYWSSRRRLSRRRVLALTGGSAAAAAFLAACGSDEPGGATGGTTGSSPTVPTGATGPTGDSSGLLATPHDSLSEAVRGGTMRFFANDEPRTLDPHQPIAPLNPMASLVYGTLLRQQPGYFEPPSGVVEGDLAESFEFAPDRLSFTMKLRPGQKWHDVSPVNGRDIDIEDVMASWTRWSETAALRPIVVNSVNPAAPVLSVSAVNDSVIEVKLSEPLIWAHKYFANYGSFSGNIVMHPKEADDAYDIRNTMIGHGPWQIADHTPSVGFTLARNPDFWEQDHAYPDQLEMPILSEYAARLGQLKAGQVYHMSPNAEDVIATKSDQPSLLLYQTKFVGNATPITYGMLPGPSGENPFLDERVRQAFSMAIDRDAWIDALYNVDAFQREGLPVTTRWNSHESSNWYVTGEWLDPQSPDFGPNAKYFQYDLQEAKALMSAAGYPNGFTATAHYPSVQFVLTRPAEPHIGMLQELGIDVRINAITEYTQEYIPIYRDGNGQFEGWAYHSVSGVSPQAISIESSLAAQYWAGGGVTFKGFSATGGDAKTGDPELNVMIEKVRLEPDDEQRLSLVHEIQRYLGKTQWGMLTPGGANGFALAWPAVQNFRVWDGPALSGGATFYDHYRHWLDQTKAPFA